MNIKAPKFLHVYNDRHGKQRIYFRRPGRTRVALPGPLFSEAFFIAYHRALADAPQVAKVGTGTKAGTFTALVKQYFGSAEFTALQTSTQAVYRGQLERFCEQHGDKHVATIATRHIDAILGAEASRSKSMASNLRKRLATLMGCAVKWDYRTDNPMLIASRIKYSTPGIRTWSDDDITKFREHWKPGSAQRIAFEILLYTGLRRSDAVRLSRNNIGADFIEISTKKSGGMVQLAIPIHPEFRTFLATVKHKHLNLIVTGKGAARSEKAFTNWIIEAARTAGLPPESSPHGIRKAACRTLAEAGCSALEIMSITGHRDIAEVELYCRAANQKRLAVSAISKAKGTV